MNVSWVPMSEDRVVSKRIVMLGTSLHTKGGIASVIKSYQAAGLFDRWDISYLPSHIDGGWTLKLRVATAALMKFLAMLLVGRVQLVHVHSASNASFWRKTAFIIPALLFYRPVLFHLHGGGFIAFYRGCNTLQRRLIRFILNHVAVVIVLSDAWQKQLSLIAPFASFRPIPNPVQVEPVNARVSCTATPTIIFMGRLEKEKGIFDLIDALVYLRARYPKLELKLAGDGNVEAVRQSAAERGVADALRFLGWIDGPEKTRMLSNADALVLPSYAEGLPMSALEAMAVGTPVVATRVGALPELIDDGVNGFLVEAGDVRGLSRAIDRLLSSDTTRRRLSKSARERIEQFYSSERVVPQIEAIYLQFGIHPKPQSVVGATT